MKSADKIHETQRSEDVFALNACIAACPKWCSRITWTSPSSRFRNTKKAQNRISAGRLQRIAEVLTVPIMFFYSGMEENRGKREVDSC